MGPGRFGLPTSRLSGVRSNQLSYEPWKNPTSALCCQTGQPQLVRTSVYNDSVSKEQQKNRCFSCQRFGNLHPGLPGSQSLNFEVIRTRFKTRLPFKRRCCSPVDFGYSTHLSALRQAYFTFSSRGDRLHTSYAPYRRMFAPAILSASFFPAQAALRLGPPNGLKQILTCKPR